MKDQIIFDTTDANTIADSDKLLSGIISTDGSTLITDTLEGAKQGLDVYVINPNLDVNLQAGDGTDITQTGGALDVNIAGGSITVTENDVYAEDSAHTTGDDGTFNLSIRIDDISVDNSALTAGTNGDYQGFFTNDKGELYVKATDTDALLTTIDSVLDSILTDTNALVVDLAAIETELLDQGTTLDSIETILSGTVTVSDAALANTAIANAANTLAVASTAEDVVASPLTNRKYLYVYNNDNRKIFIGASGVTEANGFPISPKAYMELRAGAAIDIEWTGPDAGAEIRTMEMS